MCLAIYKPRKAAIPEEYLREGFASNPHGAGFAVASGGRIEVHKGYMDFAGFMEDWQKHQRKQALVHFRLATHGARDETMTHPFWVSRDIAMIHNGIVRIETKGGNSDTAQYVEDVLAPLARSDGRFFLRPHIRTMGEAAISGSKFCFLKADGTWGIWNESDGHWKDGVWYSNHGYLRSFGFARQKHWYYAEDDAPIIVGDKPRLGVSDVIDKCLESKYFASLPNDQKWVYEDLVEAGWNVDDLDDAISIEGDSVLERMYDGHAGGEGNA